MTKPTISSRSVTLFLLGFLTLFLELTLIRYLSGNVWNLGYFPNLVLLGVFVGMGLGFVFHHHLNFEKSEKLFRKVPFFIFALIVFIHLFKPDVPGFGVGSGNVGSELYFTNVARAGRVLSYLLFAFWFVAVVGIFASISQYTAKFFKDFVPLKAYTLDIAGSCAGILAFMAISFFRLPAEAWFAILIPLFALLIHFKQPMHRWITIGTLALIPGIIAIQESRLITGGPKDQIHETIWSPYQKVRLDGTTIAVNGINHQDMFRHDQMEGLFYELPYLDRAAKPELPKYKRVLLIGAGSGNDVAMALKKGAEHIDAVEIDPAIAELGRKYHPEHPYQDSRVHLTIDDGRSFLTRSKDKYDLIIFALTDSLVKVSPMAQLRLENYLFTKQSVERAFSLLNSGGSLMFYNYYRTQWLIDKLQELLVQGTGTQPRLLHQEENFAVLLATKPTAINSLPVAPNRAIELPVDNWPFLYLQHNSIPTMYFYAMAGLALFVVLMLLVLEKTSEESEHRRNLPMKLAFVFMGIAFLLLESKSVIQFALLFGTTWINNSLVFLGILLSVLAANWVATLIKNESWVKFAFLLLMASSLITFIYPVSNLLYFDNRFLRFILASALTFSPIFFANLIFSIIFRKQAVAEHLFGWNLIGSTLGGILEYSSMALGYQALTLMVAGCYVIAMVLIFWVRLERPLPVKSSFETVSASSS